MNKLVSPWYVSFEYLKQPSLLEMQLFYTLLFIAQDTANSVCRIFPKDFIDHGGKSNKIFDDALHNLRHTHFNIQSEQNIYSEPLIVSIGGQGISRDKTEVLKNRYHSQEYLLVGIAPVLLKFLGKNPPYFKINMNHVRNFKKKHGLNLYLLLCAAPSNSTETMFKYSMLQKALHLPSSYRKCNFVKDVLEPAVHDLERVTSWKFKVNLVRGKNYSISEVIFVWLGDDKHAKIKTPKRRRELLLREVQKPLEIPCSDFSS